MNNPALCIQFYATCIRSCRVGNKTAPPHSLQGLSQKISLLVNIYKCYRATQAGVCNILPRLEFYKEEHLSYWENSVLSSLLPFSVPNRPLQPLSKSSQILYSGGGKDEGKRDKEERREAMGHISFSKK